MTKLVIIELMGLETQYDFGVEAVWLLGRINKREDSMRKRLRWILFIAGAIFFILVMRQVLDPFGSKGYVKISHGDHVHYVPEDRDPNVPISFFPRQPPGPNERILPDGRIVPK